MRPKTHAHAEVGRSRGNQAGGGRPATPGEDSVDTLHSHHRPRLIPHWRSTIATSELFWDQLLMLMEERRVVPVVGPELLRVDHDGRTVSLYALLAERLAEYLGVSADDLPLGDELNTVACRYIVKERQNRQLIYSALKTIWSRLDEPPAPEPLRDLASIGAFPLFVTTTFDPMLEQALNEVRYGGQSTTRVLTYAPDERQDLHGGALGLGSSTVYHLFVTLDFTGL